jgi:spore germination protein
VTRKRLVTWLISVFLVAAAFSVIAAWIGQLSRRSQDLALQLEAERQRNFAELVNHVQAIEAVLGKGLAAGSVRQNMLYMSEAHRRASLAAANFMSLPLPGPISATTGKFLNQVGDFAHSIARAEAAGRPMTSEQRRELARLQEAAAALADRLQKTGREAAQNGFRWVAPPLRLTGMLDGWRRGLVTRRDAPSAAKGRPSQDQSPKSLLPGGLEQISTQVEQLPVLIYDGPFSDHLEQRSAALGGEELSEEQARQRALFFLPDAGAYRVVAAIRKAGVPETWSFRLAPAAAPAGDAPAAPAYTLAVDVTQAGGHLVYFVGARQAGPARHGLEEARQIGLRYLQEHGFRDMVPTYGEVAGGFATVQYAYRHRGVIVYPDQVKVRVALDTGEVTGVDARQYVMAHRDRGELPAPAVSREQAARALNPELRVERMQLALIPTDAGDGEVLTYEFLGRMGRATYLVYVSAATGEEERILQLLQTENGSKAL